MILALGSQSYRDGAFSVFFFFWHACLLCIGKRGGGEMKPDYKNIVGNIGVYE